MDKCIVLINSIFEIGALLKIVEAFIGHRKRKVSIIIMLLVMLGTSIYINVFGGSRMFQMVHYICIFCVLIVQYEVKWIQAMIYTVLSFLLVGVLELIIYIPCSLLFKHFSIEIDFSIWIVLITFNICYIIEKKQIVFQGRKCLKNLHVNVNIYLVIVSLSIIIAFVINMIGFNKGMSLSEGIYLSISAIMLLIMFYKMTRYQTEIECHKKYQAKYGEVITEVRSRQHKFLNQINSIYALHKIYDDYDQLVERQSEELDRLRQYIMPNKILILERPLIIAHIYNKLCEAEEKNIKINTVFSSSLYEMKIPDIFLLEIIGNLLDNAIDEVESRKKNETIRFSITRVNDEVCISVGNEHDKLPYVEFRKFFSEEYSSIGEKRGLGLPYVKKIVKKYKGRMDVENIEYDNKNFFTISIYFGK